MTLNYEDIELNNKPILVTDDTTMNSKKDTTIKIDSNHVKSSESNGTKSDTHNDFIQNAMGEFGKWHLIICATVFLLKFPVAWHQFSFLFLAPNIDFWCSNQYLDKCSSECPGFEYNRTVFSQTITMEWDLVCDRKQWVNVSQSIFMFGILVGNMIFGTLADKHGRRNPLIIAVILQLFSGVLTAFVPWFWMFCVLRFLTAIATGGTMVTSFVLIMEIIGTKHRELVSVLYQIPFNLGHLTLPIFAYYFRDWKALQFALSITSVILISYYWLVPESPRWLFTVGRINESAVVLEKAAKCNNRPTETIKTDLEKYSKDMQSVSHSSGNIIDLIRTPNMRSKTLCMCFNWFVCGLSFFGIAQYIGQSEGDIFTNVAVSAAWELPGTFLCIYTMKRFGRRKTLLASNTLAGICMLLIATKILVAQIIGIEMNALFSNVQTILATAALVGMSISFPTVYLYAGELFPTVVRNIGIGTASMIARIGSMISPFAITFKIINPIIPPIILGLIPIIGALLTLLLPETRGQPLPATIEDAEQFGKKTSK